MSDLRSVETTASDIETAINEGIKQLGVTREDVIIEVLEEPTRRMLGLGNKQARVRITMIRTPAEHAAPPAVSVPPPEDEIIVFPSDAPLAEKPAKRPRAERSEGKETKEQKDPQRQAERSGRGRKPTTSASQTQEFPAENTPRFDDDEDDSSAAHLSDEEIAAEVKVGIEVLGELLKHMGLTPQITPKRAVTDGKEPRHWVLDVTGSEVSTLTGYKGEGLASLQYLTRILVSRKTGRRAHLVIDLDGYKGRREAQLRRLAQRMAEQAIQRGKAVAMEPMPPHERR
ncbi:MAG TPA: Jag N-terminal domain-containing protein, partial [Aggregatilineales bacterium]|nr:Jag N-terminal domain-containing protein [Aggregatilineales bacterium]